MIFLLRVIISKSCGYSIQLYRINQTCFSFDGDHKGEMANSSPVLLNERQNRGQFSTVRTASDALPWLAVIRLTPRCYRMVPVLKCMIAPCLGMIVMIFAHLVVELLETTQFRWWIWLATTHSSFFAVAPAKYQQNAAGNGTGKDTLTSAQGSWHTLTSIPSWGLPCRTCDLPNGKKGITLLTWL